MDVEYVREPSLGGAPRDTQFPMELATPLPSLALFAIGKFIRWEMLIRWEVDQMI